MVETVLDGTLLALYLSLLGGKGPISEKNANKTWSIQLLLSSAP